MRYNGRWALLGAALALGGVGRTAWAMAGEYGKGDPEHPISVSTWPADVTTLANRTDRVSGRWINDIDWFDYAGNAEALNDFLRQYGKLLNANVILEDETSAAFSMLPPDCNWEMNVIGWGQASASVRIRIGRPITLRALRVPPQISVSALNANNKELMAFVVAHQARQNKAALYKPNSSKPLH